MYRSAVLQSQVEQLTCESTSTHWHSQAPDKPTRAPFATQSATHFDLADEPSYEVVDISFDDRAACVHGLSPRFTSANRLRSALVVPVLDPEMAAGFLVTRTGDPDRSAAWELAAELGELPLALEQAAAYMQATGTPLARYLPLFRARQADLLARGETAGHPADLAATLGLALSRPAGVGAPAAAGLARLLAVLAPEPIPLALLLTNKPSVDMLGPEMAVVVGPLLGDLVAAGDAITALRRYSLISPDGDGLVLVHRLVQAVTRARMPLRRLTSGNQSLQS